MNTHLTAPCLFLDRDGTLIYDKHYLCDPSGVELLPHAVEGLGLLQAAGCALVVLSNQSGVGRGYFDASSVDAVNARMTELLHAQGINLTGILYCPHSPQQHCLCRKPAPGLVHEAVRRFGLEAHVRAGCFASVGDKLCDVRLAQNLGGSGVLVLSGKGQEELKKSAKSGACLPDHVAPDLPAAARWILTHVKSAGRHL